MSSSRDTVAVDYSFLACPCLNVKLHLPSPVDNADTLAGTTVQLGLGGVSMEQKILGALTLSPEGATVSCSNCNQDVYSFAPDNTALRVNKTSIAFLTGGVTFSPSNGQVVVKPGLIAGKEAIDKALAHADYSQAFRLILFTTPNAVSSEEEKAPLPSHLQRVRTILEQELEANLVAQEQRTLARIAAYKSQQMLALEESKAHTIKEKERLWHTIQQRVSTPSSSTITPAPSTPSSDNSLHQHQLSSPKGDHPYTAFDTQRAAVHPFDAIPSTLPIRFSTDTLTFAATNGGGVGGGGGNILQRWRMTDQANIATSMQLKEFDDRMHSIGMRRQSKVSGPLPQYERTGPPTAEDLAASEALASAARRQQNVDNSEDMQESPAVEQKQEENQDDSAKNAALSSGVDGKVSHGTGAARHITIVEPMEEGKAKSDGLSPHAHDDDSEAYDEDEDDEDGVVFDLDEELGFDDSTNTDAVVPDISLQNRRRSGSGEMHDGEDREDDDDEDGDDNEESSAGVGIVSANGKRASSAQSAMVVGSLRLNYLRRQKKLEKDRQKFRSEEKQLDEELQRRGPEDDDNGDDDDGFRRSLMFGTSLPIQIHRPPQGPAKSNRKLSIGGASGVAPPPPTINATTASTYTARNQYGSLANPSWTHPSQAPSHFNPPEQLTLPPASSPAGEMLRRRLSRTYGSVKEISPLAAAAAVDTSKTTTSSSSTTLSSLAQPAMAGSIPKDLYTGTGTIAIDPFMLLDDDDEDDEEYKDSVRRSQQGRSNGDGGSAMVTTSSSSYLARSAQPGFEPPHVYSARTYVGETPWEMPTRVTVKARGTDREGADLDMQLTLQMARELEEAKRTEKAELREARRRKLRHHSSSGGGGSTTTGTSVDVIREEGEQEDEEETTATNT
ncbi:hypothetical protein BGW41_002680 [Actinomortierella wolfii]|nr:hypothetical protein BGW41_002680 [Actinomortierella wolfii]